jgi:hypothetical protein
VREVAQAGLAAGEPRAGAGHLDRGVGAQRLLQGPGIGVLEAGDVLAEQFPGARLGRLDDPLRRRRDFIQPGAGALQRAFHGRRGDAEHARHLSGGEAKHFTEQQDSPLPGRQVLQAGDEREPQPLPRGDDRGGIFRLRGHQGVRHWFQPGDAWIGRADGGVRVVGGCVQAGRQCPPASLFERGQAGVGGDAVQPGAHRRPALEGVIGPPGPQVGLLHDVFGLVCRPKHPVAVRQQFPPERLGAVHELL